MAMDPKPLEELKANAERALAQTVEQTRGALIIISTMLPFELYRNRIIAGGNSVGLTSRPNARLCLQHVRQRRNLGAIGWRLHCELMAVGADVRHLVGHNEMVLGIDCEPFPS